MHKREKCTEKRMGSFSKNQPHCKGKIWGFLQFVTKDYKEKVGKMA